MALLIAMSAITSVSMSVPDNAQVSVKADISAEISEKKEQETSSVQDNTAENTEQHSHKAEKSTIKAEKEKTSKEPAPEGFSHEHSDEYWVTPGSKEKPKDEEREPVKITVILSINCENAVAKGFDISPYLLENERYDAQEGATVFDVLKALCDENGISLKYQRKSYIQGIGGLNEKDCGGASGWMYLVNGEKPPKAINSYKLQNGDVIELRYVTDSNE